MAGPTFGLKAASAYLLIAAIGAFVARYSVFSSSYMHLFAVQGALAVLTLYVLRSVLDGHAAGFRRLHWPALLWMLPSWWVLANLTMQIWAQRPGVTIDPALLQVLTLICITTFLIGFSEETMFRGIVLRSALTRLSVIQAMGLSATLFALLHLVNLIAGLPLATALYQLAFAFAVGLFLAPVALRLNNLWPLILWHWLWNFALFSAAALGITTRLPINGLILQVMLGLWLWGRALRQEARN